MVCLQCKNFVIHPYLSASEVSFSVLRVKRYRNLSFFYLYFTMWNCRAIFKSWRWH